MTKSLSWIYRLFTFGHVFLVHSHWSLRVSYLDHFTYVITDALGYHCEYFYTVYNTYNIHAFWPFWYMWFFICRFLFLLFCRWKHHLCQRQRVQVTLVILTIMKRNLCASRPRKNVPRNLQISEKSAWLKMYKRPLKMFWEFDISVFDGCWGGEGSTPPVPP